MRVLNGDERILDIDLSKIIIHKGSEDFCEPALKQESVLPTRLTENGVTIISKGDSFFPKGIKNVNELYCIGDISLLNRPAIAIVGGRKPSIYGNNQAEKFAYELAKAGLVIVSGMARGIDSAAHKGALTANGKTIAVLGCGVDICYPPENEELKKIIEKNGLVISPFPLGTAPIPSQFPSRNQIVSGLSKGVLVIECAEKSGTFSTVSAAQKQGLPVWTIPTNLDNNAGRGNIILIKKGAQFVTCAKDILDELEISSEELEVDDENAEGFVMYFHPSEAIGIEQLIQKTRLTSSEINNKLLELELNGKIKSLSNKTYILA